MLGQLVTLFSIFKTATSSALLLVLSIPTTSFAEDTLKIGYIGQDRERPPVLSNFEDYPEDEGDAGALLAIADNNTTGKFTGQSFTLVQRMLALEENPAAAVEAMVSDGIHFIVVDVSAKSLAQITASDLPDDITLFNASAEDRRFRDDECHPQLLHTALSRDMKTDALAQFLVKKRWKDWFVVSGQRVEDTLFVDSVVRSAKKFGAKIVEKKGWDGNFDARRAATAEVPLFTRGIDYDVLVVADEIGDFGNYLLFQTFDPRPVAGTQGLTAKAWGRPVEQWGATQLQERFLDQSNRWMRSRDYAAWLAVRAIGEAALRTKSYNHREIDR